MKRMRKMPFPVGVVLMGLVYLLMFLFPAGVARLEDAELFSGTVPRPAMEGELSGQAQEIPMVYALYRRRVLSGGEELIAEAEETDTAEQARSLSGTMQKLTAAGVLPDSCRKAAEAVFDLPSAIAYTGRENGFVQQSYQGIESSGYVHSVTMQQQEETGLVAACTITADDSSQPVGEETDSGTILECYRKYLGLDGLTDWRTAKTEKGGAVGWSMTGQVYLYCTFGEGRFALGVTSLPEEELETIAAGLS